MCSRYSLTSPHEAVRAAFGTANHLTFPARFNIAPTQPALIVRTGHNGALEQALVRWGLIPSWAKDPSKLSTLINARSETAAEKPSFRGAMRHRRCLVPADGFYEWTGAAGSKVPHLIRLSAPDPDAGYLMAFAGLWETWLGADGSEIDTMAILTTAANADMVTIHDRMPVILPRSTFAAWLDCASAPAAAAIDLLRPAPDGLLAVHPVGRAVNSVRAEGPQLWAGAGGAAPRLL